MVDIIIGSSQAIDPVGGKGSGTPGGMVEAQILNIRPHREKRGHAPEGEGERRKRKNLLDPPQSQVFTLLIPEGQKIPKDIDSADYRVFIRFVKQGAGHK